MGRTVSNWDDAAADAYTHLTQGKREYAAKKMLSVVDDLAVQGSATQAEMIERHGPPDLIATTFGHVTTAIHGPGAVPRPGGWYRVVMDPYTYHVNTAFASAWRAKRRLK